MKQTDRFTIFGLASVMPGLQYAIEILTEARDQIQARIHGAEEAVGSRRFDSEPPEEVPAVALAPATNGAGQKAYWARMTAKQRKAEMKRRGLLRNINKLKKKANHPRDVGHPKHKQWVKKVSEARRRQVDAMTPEERKAHFGGIARKKGAAA